ncbi:O-antigen polymerase [Arthrobacter sp. Leaf337]|uniref:O-antigen ligase family protein n=1 Tax=Arthrobacter sp. Leaf337 TaxID=1736342 RepID=UPI0006FF0B7A|nr:O-antigen ligase family protein [Arthrobacter sp. Leaf337]KQR65393.1 O-antigen polymerase [Arthrobacter sp. Leaf337]
MKNPVGARTFTWAPSLAICVMVGSLLAFLPGGLFRFAWAKVVVVLIALGAGLLAGRANQGGRLPPSTMILLGAGSIVLLLAALLSPSPAAALFGRWPRYEGAVVLAVYAATLVLGAKVLGGTDSTSRWQVLHRALALASIPLAMICILESAGLRPLGGAADLRPGATLGNASDQGLVGVMIAGALALPSLQPGKSSWLLRTGCAAAVLIAVLSGSRAALLGLVAVVCVCTLGVFLARRPGKQSRKRTPTQGLTWNGMAIAGGSLAGLALLVVLIPGARDRLFYGDTVTGRWLLWQQTLEMAWEHPWFGVGPGGFVDVFPGYQTQQWAEQTGGDFPPDSPHSWLLQALLAGGIPLLLLAVLLAVSTIRTAVIRIRSAEGTQRNTLIGALAAVVGYGVGLLTGFTSPGTTPLAAFICGGLLATTVAASTQSHTSRLRQWFQSPPARTAATAAGALAVVGGLIFAVPAAVAEWPMAAGVSAAGNGDLAQAQRHFQAAQALRPWDSDTALLAAQAFAGPAAEGDPEAAARAVEWAKVSLARTPDSVEAGLALSIGYLNSGDIPAAKQQLDELVQRAPYTSALYVQRGIAWFGLGQPEQSIADLQTAAAQSPDSPVPWQVLARVYQRVGQDGKAAQTQEQADRLSAPQISLQEFPK